MNYPETITLKVDYMYLDLAKEELEREFRGAVYAPSREFDSHLNGVVNFLWKMAQTIPAGTVLYRAVDNPYVGHKCPIYHADYGCIVVNINELPEECYE